MIRKLLKCLYVIQNISYVKDNNKNKKQYLYKYRINPYNPLSYIALLLILIVGILMFGFIGFWKETDTRNPFKWIYIH